MKFFTRKKPAEAKEPSSDQATDLEQVDEAVEAPPAEKSAGEAMPSESPPDVPSVADVQEVQEAQQVVEDTTATQREISAPPPQSQVEDSAGESAATNEERPVDQETGAQEGKAGFWSRMGLKRKKPAEASEPAPDTDAGTEQGDGPAEAPAPVMEESGHTPMATPEPEAPVIPVLEAEAPSAQLLEVETVAVETSPESGSPEGDPALVKASADQPAKDAPSAAAEKTDAQEQKVGFFSRLRLGLARTSNNLAQGLGNVFLGRKEIDAELFEELESRLLMADVGVDATLEIIERLTQRVSRKELTKPQALQDALQEELLTLLRPCEQPLDVEGHQPYVILMVGVNGVGKTTTIGKLAKHYIEDGRSVMLAAGDTFRAAAVEQLQVWGERNDVPVVAQHTGADSASVLFDALQAARTRKIDVLIADTAGRLHNKDNLMEELKKVVRVMGKIDPSAPHEVMLVLDAGTGQNALAQAEHFQKWVGVSGITLTKLDGTAKGGIIFAIAKKLQLPIRFIGVGEAVEDLRPFQAEQFIDALFDVDNASA